ncbi:Flp pilus assembly protein, ATPase CpaE [Nakamurella panacisegetis]|uniref:Flp pilus assembly protein, ATPase CpaE n=1 Tax=Nakamurella panacisegetis TaxID=1090615 RepID=A0A1H0I676_9ACTN|nr:chromosome partitioning protein [Nakamurella panacisegetis]SDO26922.1 Flp pilus assembly protein, ATPase CpaE [Nakamurella panacisegetis]
MSSGLLTAGNGQNWENDLVAALDRPGAGMSVVRRCVDIADVLTAATTGQAAAVVLSGELRRLDTEAVQRLTAAGVAVVAIYPASEPRIRTRLERIGITTLVADDDAGAAALMAAVRTAITQLAAGVNPVVAGLPPEATGFLPHPAVADPRFALPPDRGQGTSIPVPARADPPPLGQVVAVWGPAGAPGRTMLAANLAVESAEAGRPTLLIDADVYGGVLGNAFGLLDESPGLAGACRQAANGRLDLAELTRLVWAIGSNLRLLTGISRADRWPEVRPSAIPAVLGVARSMAAVTVVDCGFCLEADEEITFDTAAPRRNGATLAVLADADVLVAVGSADPPGIERLVRGLAELRDMVPEVQPLVVLNRSRRTAASPDEAIAALARFSGLGVTAVLPEDRGSTDKAWLQGIPLAQAAPGSALRKGIRDLAGALTRAGAVPSGSVPR